MKEVSAEHARAIIDKMRYMTIATVNEDGQPWNTPVAAYHDDALNFYWTSSPKSQHSKNIQSNDKIFIVIYDSTAPSEEAWGVYVQATARKIEDEVAADEAAKLFVGSPYQFTEGKFYMYDSPRRIYKAVPNKFWMNDGEGADSNYIDIRQEVSLS
jgi:nitroimidazol reductase NimA-like FMN-containing flavoprotein (pyridoxamine 5'-phosphate oxidase superfamily)